MQQEQPLDRLFFKYDLFLTGGSDCHGRYEKNSPAVGDFLAEESGAKLLMSL